MPYGTEHWDSPNKSDLMEPLKNAFKITSIAGTYEEFLNKHHLSNKTPLVFPVDYNIFKPIDVPNNSFPFQNKLKNKIVFFMPSRIHFNLKGTDKVIKAFNKVAKNNDDILLLLINWGDNKKEAQNMIKEFNLQEKVLLLNYWFSDKSLNLLYNLSDVYIDHIPSGDFASVNLSGMGRGAAFVGKPIISNYDHEANKFVIPEKPQIITASTELELANAFQYCIENKKEVNKLGLGIKDWALKYYGKNAVIKLIKLIENAAKSKNI